MAAPSEPFTWKRTWPYQDRTCGVCGLELRVEDVGEHRAYYEGGRVVRRFLWCKAHRGGRE